MHLSLAPYSAPVSFVQAPSWADFITTMVGFEVFGTHRGGAFSIGRENLSRRVAEACNVYRPKLASVIVEEIKCWVIGIKS
jgi:hypothetical protein